MRILIVNYREITKLPPVRNLVEILLHNGHEVEIIGVDETKIYEKDSRLTSISISDNGGVLYRAATFLHRRKKLCDLVEREMKGKDILWTTTDRTARELKRILPKFRHVMQLMELRDDIPEFPGQKLIKANLGKIGREAWKVVVPEYNRAHILAAWWGLVKTPYILPNKPYAVEVKRIPQYVQKVLQGIESETKKIILYQGIFLDERRVEEVAQACEGLEDYCFYMMGDMKENVKQRLSKYKNVRFIPFVSPPYHLLITKHAHIGILTYFPSNVTNSSALNVLYCAPNKIYEYALCGLPMLGNDLPGLRAPFDNYSIGVCIEWNAISIQNAILEIERKWEEMSRNCKRFYNSVDLEQIVEDIVSDDN